MKYLLLLLAFSLQAQELTPLPKSELKSYLHYGDMKLLSDVRIGQGFVNNVLPPIRPSEYLHEIYKKSHTWQFDECKKVKNQLKCATRLDFATAESMTFKWTLTGRVLRETITYTLNGSVIKVVYKGKLKRISYDGNAYQWDIGEKYLGF